MAFIILLNANKICKKKITSQDFLTMALICCIFHNVKNGRGGQLSFLALFWDAVHFWEKGFALFKTEQLLLQLDLGLSKRVSLKKEWSEALPSPPLVPTCSCLAIHLPQGLQLNKMLGGSFTLPVHPQHAVWKHEYSVTQRRAHILT